MTLKNMYVYSLLFFFVLQISLSAQDFNSVVKGKILDKDNGAPVVGANVYIAGTMWGTSSDLKGNYSIKALPSGTLELVVSMIGYEPITKAIVLRNNAILK
ncbi:carboxypeptidase-like regulatory domain-containing protein [Bacteroidota bacterium]